MNDSTGTASQTLLVVEDLHKSFSVPVLKGLNFTLEAGEIHALMGSNGAGKSTLCNIISGVHQPSDGSMWLAGEEHRPENIKAAESAGIRMVMQELNLFPTLSIAENICFRSLHSDSPSGKCGFINKSELNARTKSALALLNLEHLDPEMPVSALGIGQRQLVEIARVISEPLHLLILDEPTASLTDPEIDQLFAQLKLLKSTGVGIIYISHRMDEIRRIADRVSVLRDGELIKTVASGEINADQILQLMSDESFTKATLSRRDRPAGKTLLQVEGLGRRGKFKNISMQVRACEVLGIGGLIGSGRTEILRAIFGADPADYGGLRFSADNFKSARRIRSPQQAVAEGIGLVVEDRKDQGLMLDCAITENISLSRLRSLSRGPGIVDQGEEKSLVEQIAGQLGIKYHHLSQPIRELSGGNQQKALIARWLLQDLDILMFDEPSRGVDARAKTVIQQLIRELAHPPNPETGQTPKAVILVSSETRELIDVSDRILIISNGKIAGEFDADGVTEEELLEASFKYYATAERASTGLSAMTDQH